MSLRHKVCFLIPDSTMEVKETLGGTSWGYAVSIPSAEFLLLLLAPTHNWCPLRSSGSCRFQLSTSSQLRWRPSGPQHVARPCARRSPHGPRPRPPVCCFSEHASARAGPDQDKQRASAMLSPARPTADSWLASPSPASAALGQLGLRRQIYPQMLSCCFLRPTLRDR